MSTNSSQQDLDRRDLSLAGINSALSERVPKLSNDPHTQRAAVAVILHAIEDADPQVLIIERTQRDGDPWSGDLAFPGGRLEPEDAHEQAAAQRETLEEVGLDLSACPMLGRLDDRTARVQPITVSAFVYQLDVIPAFLLSDEVARTMWVPLANLVDPDRQCAHGDYPAVDLLGPGRPLLWGVTYHFLCLLLQRSPETDCIL